jgi:hypothetical protein
MRPATSAGASSSVEVIATAAEFVAMADTGDGALHVARAPDSADAVGVNAGTGLAYARPRYACACYRRRIGTVCRAPARRGRAPCHVSLSSDVGTHERGDAFDAFADHAGDAA